MSLKIENAETCRLASELAELTGETITEAITVALRQCLERERRRRVEELLEMGDRFAARMGPGSAATDHEDVLYGEDGLPG